MSFQKLSVLKIVLTGLTQILRIPSNLWVELKEYLTAIILPFLISAFMGLFVGGPCS
jgi:hypothetical protein